MDICHDSSYFPGSSSPHWIHDVFLSFRGKDTRKNFTDHLYTALDQAGIQTFMDDHELETGKDISAELVKAIRESRISIVVFSENYAFSTWCLNELENMIDCRKKIGQFVLPVFYNVDPSDIRKQSGSYKKAFARHEQFVDDMMKVKRWRAVLSETANLSGLNLEDVADRSESKFIKKIVEEVQHVVNHTNLDVAVYPVGISSRVEEVLSLLGMGLGGIRIIGIFGMGGIGKTTTVKALYNRLFHLFQGSCFIADIQKVAEQYNGLAHLQEILLSEILRKDFKIHHVDKGISLLRCRLRSKKLLIVLDDLNELSQLYALAGEHGWFGSGSRIIITTRNQHLLRGPSVDESYEARGLSNNESMKLFSWHAFRKESPPEDFIKLSVYIVRYTQGLPLALEVLGSHLYGRTVIEWGSAFRKLQRIPQFQIQQTLVISFDGLDDNEKDIFLDIACFFIGMDKDYVINILNGCGFYAEIGLSVLTSRCLLTIGKNNVLQMHDLLVDMARQIVHQQSPNEPEKRSRLWCHEDILDVLKQDKGTKEVKGLFLEQIANEQVCIEAKTFKKMHKLRLLKISNVNLTGSFKHSFKELRWLSWHRCSFDCLPSNFRLEKLVILDMQYSNMNKLWHMKFFKNLKILNLSYSMCLHTTPDFSEVGNLEKLLLDGCHNLCEIHPSIGRLNRLLELTLKDCKKLRYLPNDICNLRSLESLNLERCRKFEVFPEQLGEMEGLKELHADYTAISQLPDSVGLLSSLVQLDLKSCQRLRYLPSSIGNLKLLKRLNLYGCSSLKSLPDQLGNMECLSELRVDYTAIIKLPESIELLSNLVCLNLMGCRIKTFPNNFCNLRSLEHLDISGCMSLEQLPQPLGNMQSLRVLNISGTGITQSPDPTIAQLSNLRMLWLMDCVNLSSLPQLPPNLETLNGSNCISMVNLPNISHLKQLQELYLENWDMLSEIQGLENLTSLRRLRLNGCQNLDTTFMDNFIRERSEQGVELQLHLSRGKVPDWFSHPSMGSKTTTFKMPVQWETTFIGIIFWAAYAAAKNDNVTKYHDPHLVIKNAANRKVVTEWHEAVTILDGEHSLVVMVPLSCNSENNIDKIEVCIEEEPDVEVEYGVHLVFKSQIHEDSGGHSWNANGYGDDHVNDIHFKEKV